MFSLKSLNAKVSNEGWEKTLPKTLKVLAWGKNETNDGDVYLTDETLKHFNANQMKTGRDKDVPLDFDHNTVKGSKEYVQGAPKHIAAYGDPVIVPGDGLYLRNLTWTDEGKKYAKNYKDLSPAAVLNEKNIIVGLDSVALTPTGAVRDLTFYSAPDFNDMIKEMTSNLKDGLVFNDAGDLYNKDGANAGVKKTGDKYEVNTNLDSDDNDEDDDDGKDHSPDCMCGTCMSSMNENFDSDDHYSKYGDVSYADTENHKYPINNEKHVRAAWSYINMPKNAGKYDSGKLSAIKGKIKGAAKKYGIEISAKSADNKEVKTMSAMLSEDRAYFPRPDAYKAQPPYYNTMNTNIIKKMSSDEVIKKMAAEVGLDGETDQEKVLFAFLAKYEGLVAEYSEQIVKKDNTNEGGLKGFSADMNNLLKEVADLKTKSENDQKEYEAKLRKTILETATKDGKVIALSADTVATLPIKVLEEIVEKTPKTVPLHASIRPTTGEGAKAGSFDSETMRLFHAGDVNLNKSTIVKNVDEARRNSVKMLSAIANR